MYYKNLLLLMMLLSLTFFENVSFANEENEALFEAFQTNSQDLKQNQINNLKKYTAWWNALPQRQKQIAHVIDQVEEKYKMNNNGMPILNSSENVARISNTFASKSLSDINIVRIRMQQHMDNYDDAQKLDELSRDYENLIKKIKEDTKK